MGKNPTLLIDTYKQWSEYLIESFVLIIYNYRLQLSRWKINDPENKIEAQKTNFVFNYDSFWYAMKNHNYSSDWNIEFLGDSQVSPVFTTFKQRPWLADWRRVHVVINKLGTYGWPLVVSGGAVTSPSFIFFVYISLIIKRYVYKINHMVSNFDHFLLGRLLMLFSQLDQHNLGAHCLTTELAVTFKQTQQHVLITIALMFVFFIQQLITHYR